VALWYQRWWRGRRIQWPDGALGKLQLSRVTVGGATCFIGGAFFVSAVFIQPTPHIIGIAYIKITDTNNVTL
jgi:hypothetical protein